jgi:leucyl-tRNA synthetase
VTIVVQVNGKLRDKFKVERDLPEDEVKEKALGLSRIHNLVSGREIRKLIYVKNKIVNIVV